MRVALFLLPLLLLLVGCEEPAKTSEPTSKPAANTPDPAPVLKEMDIDQVPDEAHKPLTNPKDGEEVAVFETNLGKIVVRFFPDVAPKHVENFLKLAKEGYYDGTRFHRVIPGFMIQGGDPNSKDDDRMNDGAGGPGYTIKGEFNKVPHVRGILSTARTMDPDSAGSQFFVVVADSHFLNPKFYEDGTVVPGKEGYTVFGAVVSGIEVADKIVNLPRDANDNPLPDNPAVLKKVKIAKWPVK